jgi:hypothetical protein
MSLTSTITLAAESSSASGINHWVVGAITLGILLVLMLGLLTFGRGRDHS